MKLFIQRHGALLELALFTGFVGFGVTSVPLFQSAEFVAGWLVLGVSLGCLVIEQCLIARHIKANPDDWQGGAF